MTVWRRFKTELAGLLLDRPRYAFALRFPRMARLVGRSWIDLRNRGERLLRRSGQRGVVCDWKWTSHLYFCERDPGTAMRLMRRALDEWPVEFRDVPSWLPDTPLKVSFVVGHRGAERIPNLMATVRSIAAQTVPVECIVVEQSRSALLPGRIPPWARYLHTPPPEGDMPYSRSWAFNVGARAATGSILVLHDNDLAVPARYAEELIRIFDNRFEAARLQRFLFYLDAEETAAVVDEKRIPFHRPPTLVLQNAEGSTLAVDRNVYFELGGHDEAFVGWGGEDNEMLDRCRTRRLHDASYLPFVHLFHSAQPGKGDSIRNYELYEQRMKIPVEQRIAELTRRPFGSMSGPGF